MYICFNQVRGLSSIQQVSLPLNGRLNRTLAVMSSPPPIFMFQHFSNQWYLPFRGHCYLRNRHLTGKRTCTFNGISFRCLRIRRFSKRFTSFSIRPNLFLRTASSVRTSQNYPDYMVKTLIAVTVAGDNEHLFSDFFFKRGKCGNFSKNAGCVNTVLLNYFF